MITLDRPQVRNSIDHASIEELHVVCAELEVQPRILIITRAGGVFASGSDIAFGSGRWFGMNSREYRPGIDQDKSHVRHALDEVSPGGGA